MFVLSIECSRKRVSFQPRLPESLEYQVVLELADGPDADTGKQGMRIFPNAANFRHPSQQLHCLLGSNQESPRRRDIVTPDVAEMVKQVRASCVAFDDSSGYPSFLEPTAPDPLARCPSSLEESWACPGRLFGPPAKGDRSRRADP